MKGKKGQTVLLGIMIFVMGFIVLVQMITPIKDQITELRNASNLDCENNTISFGSRSTCVIADAGLFYFFGAGLAALGALLGGKFIFERARQ